MTLNVMQFFDQAVSEYDELIQAAIPRYDEIFWAMFYYLPEDFNPTNILELGCGTGNLTRLIAKRWPESQITIVDISKEMLKEGSTITIVGYQTRRGADVSETVSNSELAARVRVETQAAIAQIEFADGRKIAVLNNVPEIPKK